MKPVHTDMSSLVRSQIAMSSKRQSPLASGPENMREEKDVDDVFEQSGCGDASPEDIAEGLKVKIIERLIEGINEYLQSTDKRLSCRFHEPTGRTVVTVVNNVTGEVIKEIPSEKTLSLATKMKAMNSLLLDETI